LAQALDKEKRQFAEACRVLYDKGLVSGVGGNLCAQSGELFLLTPTGYSLRDVGKDEISVLNADHELVEGPPPTKDMGVHLGLLRIRTDMKVSCHVHGAHIIAASCLLEPSPDSIPPLTPGFAYFAYPLQMLPFLVPGSKELEKAVIDALAKNEHKALLLQNHGLITLGKSYPEAIDIAEEVEEAARIYLLTQGKGRSLTKEQVQRIKKL